MSGVTIIVDQVKSGDIAKHFTAVTDSSGRYKISKLPSGTYNVSVDTSSGTGSVYEPVASQTGIILFSGQTKYANFALVKKKGIALVGSMALKFIKSL